MRNYVQQDGPVDLDLDLETRNPNIQKASETKFKGDDEKTLRRHDVDVLHRLTRTHRNDIQWAKRHVIQYDYNPTYMIKRTDYPPQPHVHPEPV